MSTVIAGLRWLFQLECRALYQLSRLFTVIARQPVVLDLGLVALLFALGARYGWWSAVVPLLVVVLTWDVAALVIRRRHARERISA